MAIEGTYYIINNAKASALDRDSTREPLDPEDLSNLRRDKDGTMFIINSVETIPADNYVTKFASRSAMIEYINGTAAWITADMTATRTEQAEVSMTGITATAPNNLLYSWIPKMIMKAGTADLESVTATSEAFTAGENTDTETLAIREWSDINKMVKATLQGYIGGGEEPIISSTVYDDSMIAIKGATSGINLAQTAVMSTDWTILIGFQPADGSSMNVYMMGDATTPQGFLIPRTDKLNWVKYTGEEAVTLKEFPLSEGQVIGERGSITQMYPIFIQYNKETGAVSVPVVGEEGYAIGEENTFIPEEETDRPIYPTDFQRVDGETEALINLRINETDSRTNVYAGCFAVWSKQLSIAEMNSLRFYILSL
jgi:hypothetical protein